MANKKFEDYVIAGDNITLTYDNNADTVTIDAAGNVDSVNGQTGVVVLTKTDIGLGNVDNTSDANKPISSATQTALNSKQDTLVSGTNIKTVNSNSLVGSGDVVIDKTSIGLGNVTNVDTTNASNISSGTLSDSRLSANVTTQGNTFNAANKLVQLDGTAKLPAVDGSQLTNLPTPSTPTLAQVTTVGNTTTNSISVGKITSKGLGDVITIDSTTLGSRATLKLISDAASYTQLVGNGTEFNIITLGTTPLTFGTNSAERMRIFSSTGNVGINTTTDAGYKLDVNGSTRLNGALTLGMTPIVAASIMSTHKLQITIAGTTYYLLASNI